MARQWDPQRAQAGVLPGEEVHNRLGTITRAARRMNVLIEDLLDVSRLDAGLKLALQVSALPAGPLLRDAVELARPQAQNVRLSLEEGEELPPVLMDRNRMLQVFSNLVSNALKFTPSGGEVRVGARVKDAQVEFYVADTGPGISAEAREHLFERFWQAQPGSSPGGGARAVHRQGHHRRARRPGARGERAGPRQHLLLLRARGGLERVLSASLLLILMGFHRFECFKAGVHTLRYVVARWLPVLLCLALVGCRGAAQYVRHVPDAQERCVYVPSFDEAAATGKEAHSDGTRVHVLLVAAANSPVAPPAASPPPALEGLPGEGLGDGIPRGVLSLVLEGGSGAEIGAGGAAGKAVVGGAFVAAVGSGLLVCLTARAALDGEKTSIEIADEYYGTHFGDVEGWLQGHYPDAAPPPGAASQLKPDEKAEKRLGRIYVTYTKLNKMTHNYYVGRTSMITDLTLPLQLQAALAVLLRDRSHHLDENAEPNDAVFREAEVDTFDVGTAVDYGQRYEDVAYWRIRGREQQLIDSEGGARSDTGKPYRTENAVRGVAKDNPRGRRFHDAASALWAQLHPYTGY